MSVEGWSRFPHGCDRVFLVIIELVVVPGPVVPSSSFMGPSTLSIQEIIHFCITLNIIVLLQFVISIISQLHHYFFVDSD